MTPSQQYDYQKRETLEYFCEADAVDEVLHDIKSLRGTTIPLIDEEALEDIIEEIDEYIHYNESLEYILRHVPSEAKKLLVQPASKQDII